ncbi:ATP-dependent 6-phosphofructokinase [Leptospira santarosai]|uniref:ATP-dependent 6-phosphofructokinase n=1 Tax=Leptospira santarosai serovar Arenal str. MAVJ 401 TaxID=1049976 RepID=M6JKP0_9LEPT|nr:ATP-dependent 6-phosphofructokinase [Leptospira santarosai]EMN22286.1 phosphofructokinase [Leptospira santarosai serovar Arenal str. MAVJ 401]MDI7187543.1 ATP-dependent 6-phosphofructokinase [Leptospira santarosai]MDI7188511.1 ATP-dependent 6-phosphofructokinase [Leptospira santarosai]MDI7199702.1 ATP-dependent 6-phosphofructokinase [Leptospira santarosai]MDI7208304.1 ATP-dependent 6-phosphofructokinase [Leptospira santarosai]
METRIRNFGECSIPSPANYEHYTSDSSRLIFKTVFQSEEDWNSYVKSNPDFFEQAGPREKIYFPPEEVTAGIVTCGGLCPGINDVIRGIVMELYYRYGVSRILGFPYGYRGLVKKYSHEPIELTPEKVAHIVDEGGSMLASSRGNQSPVEMADCLVFYGIKILFCIGGDGTLRGAREIVDELARRKTEISVIGIPKTIDNDINYVQKTFGFSTAFSKAMEAVECAHVEAKGAPNGIGLVKLMGRHSGFIAVNAALASRNVNYCLIPEVNFDLYGNGAFLDDLEKRIRKKGHAVIIVAEGAGQKFFDSKEERDSSGNLKLKDIGLFLKDTMAEFFKEKNIPVNIKYIDPSYIIRSIPANAEDSVFCGFLAQSAVHAGMAGKTDMVVGMWNNVFIHLPISVAIQERKVLQPDKSTLWRSLLASTGQPAHMIAK